MMKIKTVLFLLPFLLPSLFLLNGCSQGAPQSVPFGASSKADSAVLRERGFTETEFTGTGFNSATAQDEAFQNRETVQDAANDFSRPVEKSRKLVKTATIEIRADRSLLDDEGKITGAVEKIDELLNAYSAYAGRSVVYENSLNYTIRVPGNSYEAMLSGLSVLGKVTSRTETAEDVTLNYYDLSGRLATKQALLQTFRSYLVKAQTIEDIMSVETRIAELQNEIDWLGTELAELSNLVDYATINLILRSPQAATGYTLGDRIADLFESFGDAASGALVVILGIVIFGIPLIVVFLAVFWLLFGRIGLLKKAFRLAAGSSPYKAGVKSGSDPGAGSISDTGSKPGIGIKSDTEIKKE
jgi:hypothetical protein